MVDAFPLATIDQHNPGAFSFRFKATASGTLFQVLPRRDPTEPRFWCVVVVRCAPSGLVDSSESPWVGQRGLRREELAETMAAIRNDIDHWITEPAQSQLKTWLLTAPPIEDDKGRPELARARSTALASKSPANVATSS